MFMEPHCIVGRDWLEPLLVQLMRSPNHATVMPCGPLVMPCRPLVRVRARPALLGCALSCEEPALRTALRTALARAVRIAMIHRCECGIDGMLTSKVETALTVAMVLTVQMVVMDLVFAANPKKNRVFSPNAVTVTPTCSEQ